LVPEGVSRFQEDVPDGSGTKIFLGEGKRKPRYWMRLLWGRNFVEGRIKGVRKRGKGKGLRVEWPEK